MASDYKSIYLKDLLPIIDNVAVENMVQPVFSGKKSDGTYMTMAEISNQNSLSAMHNEGIREMALMLKNRLLKEDEDD